MPSFRPTVGNKISSILSMSNIDLIHFLDRESEENPIIEIENQLVEQVADLSRFKMGNNKSTRDESEDHDIFGKRVDTGITLEDYLVGQIDIKQFKATELQLLYTIVKMIDENGYLREEVHELIRLLGTDEITVYRLLNYIKTLEPMGIGATNFRECLKLQLLQKGKLNNTLEQMIDHYLEFLSKGNFGKVSREIGITVRQVKSYYKLIKSLNPKPGNGFGRKENQYIIPDMIFQVNEEGYEVTLNNQSLPKVMISSYWNNMLKQSINDVEARRYLESKWGEAKRLFNAVEDRKKTLLSVGAFIAERQYQFFKTGNAIYLMPLRLKDIAEVVGVHESTISRAVNTKYIMCRHGIYSLKYFLSSSVAKKDAYYREGMQNVSKDSVKEYIKEIIKQENKKKPMSDSQIQKQLKIFKFEISRRTVMKYREELGIGSSLQRGEKGV